ncbi:hypothetical protein AT959_12175 [Dechloromonas denitrificans]|uniref:Uncharacterized protein n=1 Tax=Dechloromonas denitrificans TaxID=281362 RepID=A0A133XGP7_9RHOO|nr:hypothetical protein AT959_12175 [Dechloromonas denitrificans]
MLDNIFTIESQISDIVIIEDRKQIDIMFIYFRREEHQARIFNLDRVLNARRQEKIIAQPVIKPGPA